MPEWIRVEYMSLSELNIPACLLDPNYGWDPETIASGSFYALPFLGVTKAGFFKRNRKWYNMSQLPGQPMKLIQLKGVRVKFKEDWEYHNPICYIKIYRTGHAENIHIL